MHGDRDSVDALRSVEIMLDAFPEGGTNLDAVRTTSLLSKAPRLLRAPDLQLATPHFLLAA